MSLCKHVNWTVNLVTCVEITKLLIKGFKLVPELYIPSVRDDPMGFIYIYTLFCTIYLDVTHNIFPISLPKSSNVQIVCLRKISNKNIKFINDNFS